MNRDGAATSVPKQGLLMVYTGDGKGKTTAALGMALRAVGLGKRVCFIQFIKGTWHYSELDAIPRLAPELEFHRTGAGFYKIVDDKYPEEVHRAAAEAGLALAAEKLASGDYFLVVLDEINNTLAEGLLPLDPALRALEGRAPATNVLLTGRNAAPEIVELADLVTEMREVKHPFQQGKLARKGIDF